MELSQELEILNERWNLILGKFDLEGKINLMKIVISKAENILAGDNSISRNKLSQTSSFCLD